MEDPDVDWKIEEDVDWKIEEYLSSSDYLEEEESKSNVKWILEKGIGIGKKVVITGFVISSVPLVLPSVIVVSALGLAVSVPFGVMFASYTCTQKLMNMLLPIPTSYPLLEYDEMFEDEEEEDGEPKAKENGIEYVNMEEEEKEQMEDIREGIEKRIELVKNENELPQEYDDHLKDIRKDDEERLATGDESFKEKGYEEDVDEYLEVRDERPAEVIDVKIEGEGVEGEDEAVHGESKDEEPLPEVKRIVVVVGGEIRSDDFGKSGNLVVIARGVGGEFQNNQRAIDNEEGEDLKKESVGLLEKIRDEGNAGDAAKKKKKKKKIKGGAEKSHVEGKDGHRNVGIMKELENPIEKENEHLETLVHMTEEDNKKRATTNSEEHKKNGVETWSILEDKNKKLQKVVEAAIGSDRTKGEEKYLEKNPNKQGRTYEDNIGSVAKKVEHVVEVVEPAVEIEDTILEKRGAGNRDTVVARELTMNYSTLIHGKHAAENGHSILEEKQKPAQSSEVILQQQGTGRNVSSELGEDLIPENEENVIYPNGATRETADENDLADQKFSEVDQNYQGNGRATEYTLNEDVDLIGVPITATRPDPKHDDNCSQVESVVPSAKDTIVDDSKIWEQIDALRTIVGYRATPHRSCIDEMKALYIFTGVEPPSSFENTTGLAELNDKLRFLMSIVGVK